MLQFITHRNDLFDEISGTRAVLEGGCRWVQLRMKEASEEEFLRTGAEVGRLCRACGVEKVLTADAFDLAAVRKALEECTAYDGVSVLITRGDCVFVSRSPKPARVVDADKCIACGKCIQSGCPSVVLSDEKHPRTGKRKARIEPVTCVGCGICAQICPVHAISGPEQA